MKVIKRLISALVCVALFYIPNAIIGEVPIATNITYFLVLISTIISVFCIGTVITAKK
jgi:uncharacterized membrane protein YuzA (DUF378 family)